MAPLVLASITNPAIRGEVNPQIYQLLHYAGIIGLFFALGTVIVEGNTRINKFGAILHGISLVLILLGGFGLLAKVHDNNFAPWVIGKLLIWFLLMGSLTFAKRKYLPQQTIIAIILILGLAAALLAVFKPGQ